MSANKKLTTMGVFQDTLSIFRELSEKTRIPLLQLMDELAKEISVIIHDGLPDDTTRISYMPKAFLDKSCVIMHFSRLTCGIGDAELKNLLEKPSISGKLVKVTE